MKVAPAEMENREYASWKSLELLDTLLALADAGHSHAVMEMFQVRLLGAHQIMSFATICYHYQLNPDSPKYRLQSNPSGRGTECID